MGTSVSMGEKFWHYQCVGNRGGDTENVSSQCRLIGVTGGTVLEFEEEGEVQGETGKETGDNEEEAGEE